MAISKVYQRINFVNGKNGGTPLNGASSKQQAIDQAIGNLNKIDYALDQVDTRVVEISNERYDSRNYALQSQSYATGDAFLDDERTIPYRPGQDTDNAKYYYTQVSSMHNEVSTDKNSVTQMTSTVTQAKTDTLTYRNEAQGYSESASESAELSSTKAEESKSYSEIAENLATETEGYKNSAYEYKEEAKGYSESALDSKNQAYASATKSEEASSTAITLLESATDLMQETQKIAIGSSFQIDIASGCIFYQSQDFDFSINPLTGNLEYELI